MDNDILDLWTKADRLTTTEVRALLQHIQDIRTAGEDFPLLDALLHKDLRDFCSPQA